VHNTYIIAEHSDGLWLVEQHIAHERVLYEQIAAAWQLLPLEPPLILSHLSERQIERLQEIELTVEPFGEDLWAIRTAPAPLLMREDLAAAITELSLGGDLQAAQVAVACRCAIRNGTQLTLAEMQNLLDRWQRTRNPRTCPHGRPIYLSFKESSLARSFRRHWVIGKSHGI
jgi:DNA mismatch repair protein MutL